MARRVGATSFLLVCVLIAGGLLGGLGLGRPESLHAITVAMPPLEQNALLYVAEARDLFRRYGVDVTLEEYDTGLATVDALLAGEADIAELCEFPFLEPVLEGQPLRILAVNDRFENDYLLARRDRGITTTADLEGKRIGVIAGTIPEFYLGRHLDLHGIPAQAVTVVDTGTAARTTAAIVSGEVDAVVAFEPHVRTIQQQLADKVATWPVQNAQLVYGILVAHADWVSAHGDAVESFLRALAEAEAFVAAHPEQAKAIVQDRLNVDAGYVADVWPLHQFSLSLDLSLILALNDEARWMIESGHVTDMILPDFKDYLYLDGLRAVEPEAVTIVP